MCVAVVACAGVARAQGSTRVVVLSQRVTNVGPAEVTEFDQIQGVAITCNDTHFIRQSHSEDESIHFHELIHVCGLAVFRGPKTLQNRGDFEIGQLAAVPQSRGLFARPWNRRKSLSQDSQSPQNGKPHNMLLERTTRVVACEYLLPKPR